MKEDLETFTSTLAGFTGSTVFYRHRLMQSVRYTEGVQYLAETAGAYWLIDAIASHQLNSKVRAEGFQVWTLQRNDDDTWTLSCTDGNEHGLVVQQIEFSDFPLSMIEVWFVGGTMLLPSEY